jgi:methyltransferase family protein
MLKNAVKFALARAGYEIRKIPRVAHDGQGFTLYSYLKPDGSFDYDKYRQIQVEGNKKKLGWVWVREPNISFLADYIRKTIGQPEFGICHGTRRGLEQQWFRKYLGCEVIGTEISDTANDFPHTIQWDFHEVKREWIDSVDFIYSNSLDHSYDPPKCLNAWMQCVRPGGLCILEHGSLSTPEGASELDPFGAELEHMPYLITLWGNGKFCVRQILSAPEKDPTLKYLAFIVIQRL